MGGTWALALPSKATGDPGQGPGGKWDPRAACPQGHTRVISAFFWPHHARILGPRSGVEPARPAAKARGLTAGPPGRPRGGEPSLPESRCSACRSSATGLFSRRLGASAPGPQEASAGGPRAVTLAPCLSPWQQPTSKDVPEGAWGRRGSNPGTPPPPPPHTSPTGGPARRPWLQRRFV